MWHILCMFPLCILTMDRHICPHMLSAVPVASVSRGKWVRQAQRRGTGTQNTQLALDWCCKQIQMHTHLHKHSPPLRTPLLSASGKSIIRKNRTELQMKIWWSWKRRGGLRTLCVHVCLSMCVIAYSPLGWSLYQHPLMALKLGKSNQIISLGSLKWTQAARTQHLAVIDSATFDTHCNRVRLLQPHRRMCFHHICSGFIYSSLSASAPRSSLLKADGVSTIRCRLRGRRWTRLEKCTTVSEYIQVMLPERPEYQKRRSVSIEVWVRDGSYLTDKFTSLSPSCNYS